MFEDFKNDSRTFLAGYARDLELEVDLDALNYSPDLPAYGDWSVRIARLANLFSREELPYKYYLLHIPRVHGWLHQMLSNWNRVDWLRKASPAKRYLGRQNVAEIEARFAESNAALEEEFELGLPERGYPV